MRRKTSSLMTYSSRNRIIAQCNQMLCVVPRQGYQILIPAIRVQQQGSSQQVCDPKLHFWSICLGTGSQLLFRTFSLWSNPQSLFGAGGLCWLLSCKQLSKSWRHPRPGIGVKIIGNTDVGVPEGLTGGMDAV